MNSATIKELMARYNEYKAKWEGTEEEFHAWFTEQVQAA